MDGIKSMDLYNNARSYFVERVIQNSFADSFNGSYAFKSFRALDVMSYTRINLNDYDVANTQYPFVPSTNASLKFTLGTSDHEVGLVSYPNHIRHSAL